MADKDTQICCCGASTWASLIAWFQIVAAVLGINGASVELAAVDQIKDGDKLIDEGQQKVVKAALILDLVLVIVEFHLGILLLIGNKSEKLGLLCTWLIITWVCAVLGVISGIVSMTVGNVSSFVCILISVAISGFMIHVVHRRIQDVKIGSGGPSSGS